MCMVRVHHKLRSPLYRKARARIDDGGVPPLAGPMARSASGAFVIGIWGWFERIVLLATLISIAIGLWAFRIDYEDRVEDRIVRRETLTEIQDARAARREDAIARAWSLLTTPATGNSGKVAALEFLVAEKVPLIGIDLSCARMGGEENWNAETYTCLRPTYLRGAKIAGAMLDGANLSGVDLTGADMREVSMIGAHLDGVLIDGVNMRRAVLRAATLKHADIRNSDLTQADFTYVDAERIKLFEVVADEINLIAAIFTHASLLNVSAKSALLDQADLTSARLKAVDMSMASTRQRPLETYFVPRRFGEGNPMVDYPLGDKSYSFKLASLCDVDFGGSDLFGVDFTQTILAFVRFDGSYLRRSDFTSAEFHTSGCNPSVSRDGSKPTGSLTANDVTFRGANISGAKFDDLFERYGPIYARVRQDDQSVFWWPSYGLAQDFSEAWAWDNDRPSGRLIGQYKLCRSGNTNVCFQFPGKERTCFASSLYDLHTDPEEFPDPCLPPRGR